MLPKEVSKISMEFNTKIYGGHRGARYADLPFHTFSMISTVRKKGESPEQRSGRHSASSPQPPTFLPLTRPRKFWREMLPRIKYRNPSIPIEISRHTSPDGPALLHIYTDAMHPNTPDGSSNTSVPSLHTQSGTAATPPSGTPNARNTLVPDATAPSHTINIRDQAPSEILDALLATLPESQVVRPTKEEESQMEEMKEFKERSEADRVMVREKLLKERREAELLRIARGETVAS